MLLNVNTKTRFADRRRTMRLQSFGLDERALQDILFKSLDDTVAKILKSI